MSKHAQTPAPPQMLVLLMLLYVLFAPVGWAILGVLVAWEVIEGRAAQIAGFVIAIFATHWIYSVKRHTGFKFERRS